MMCECGCGGLAPIATYSSARYGWTRGEPKRFIHGHHRRGVAHTEETKRKMGRPKSLLTREERLEQIRARGRRHYISKGRFVAQARRYGLSVEVYGEMYARQGGRCAICDEHEKRTSKDGATYLLSVDHDHTTGHIRALLCHSCNAALGLMGDDPERIQQMLTYLEEHK